MGQTADLMKALYYSRRYETQAARVEPTQQEEPKPRRMRRAARVVSPEPQDCVIGIA